jgi:hypothetical protein
MSQSHDSFASYLDRVPFTILTIGQAALSEIGRAPVLGPKVVAGPLPSLPLKAYIPDAARKGSYGDKWASE